MLRLPGVFLAVVACGVGCSFKGSGDPVDAPIVDLDAADSIDAPIDAACSAHCDGNGDLVTCTSGSENPPTDCPLGCTAVGGPHCQQIIPSNGATTQDLLNVTGSLDIAAATTFIMNTDTGLIVDGAGITIRPAGGPGVMNGIGYRTMVQPGVGVPEVAIFSVQALTIANGPGAVASGRLRIIGARSAIILASGAVTISGRVDAGAGADALGIDCKSCAGPGGGPGGGAGNAGNDGNGCAPGLHGNNVAGGTGGQTGGGGGGNATAGAAGGDFNTVGGGGITSDLTACPGPDLVPLEGGSGGGGGAADLLAPAFGGGGGGAVQITSMVSIAVTGDDADLYAGGAGGEGSLIQFGGGGGGGGGGILLEAPTVMLQNAKLTANGGGGGSGRTVSSGENGNRSATRASGGTGDGTGNNNGRGGLGSVGSGVNQNATVGSAGATGTGGGGAGAGVIRLNAVTAPTIAGGTISPIHSVGTASVQ